METTVRTDAWHISQLVRQRAVAERINSAEDIAAIDRELAGFDFITQGAVEQGRRFEGFAFGGERLVIDIDRQTAWYRVTWDVAYDHMPQTFGHWITLLGHIGTLAELPVWRELAD